MLLLCYLKSGARGAAKTHLPTDEAALMQLAQQHELPSLIIEYRCLTNIITKWLEPEWVAKATAEATAATAEAAAEAGPMTAAAAARAGLQAAAAGVAGLAAAAAAGGAAERSLGPGGVFVSRVRCSWNQLATATGRLSSSSPNLQVGYHHSASCTVGVVGIPMIRQFGY